MFGLSWSVEEVSKTQCCCQEDHCRGLAVPRPSSPLPLSLPHWTTLVFALQSRPLVSLAVGRAVQHLEDHLHVVGGAGAADPPVEVRPGAGRDEVIVLARVELQTPRTGTEWPAMEKMLTRWQTQILWLIYGYRPLLTTRKYLQNSHSCNCKIYS